MKIIKITAIVILAVLCFSCESWLDVEPKTEIKSDLMFQTESGFKDAIIGCYTLMGDRSLYGRELTSGFMDIIAQQFSINASASSYARIKDFEYDKADNIINAIWNNTYNVIANLNNLIENTEKQKELIHPTHYHIIRGEALGLRAFLHFDLLRMFGWGDLAQSPSHLEKVCIPYVTEYSKVITKQYTVKEVLEFVHQDLEAAEELLVNYDPWSVKHKSDDYTLPNDDKFYTNRMTRFNYWAVRATQARVYLWEGKRDKALTYLMDFIENRSQITNLRWVPDQSMNLTSGEANLDLTFSTEHLFRLDVYKLFENLKDLIDPKYNSPNPNNSLFSHDPSYRRKLFEIDNGVGVSDYRYTRLYTEPELANRKFYEVANYKYPNMMPLIRMSEMYYMAAECLNATGKSKQAVELLNEVRKARGIASVHNLPTNISQENLTLEIEKEWKKEFLGEGQMFYFYKRLGYAQIPNSTALASEKVYVLPIPEDEINIGGRDKNETVEDKNEGE